MKYYQIINVLHLSIFSLFFFSSAIFLTSKLNQFPEGSEAFFDWNVSTLSLIVSAIGTLFMIIFRWRADVRNSQKMAEEAQRNEARFIKLENEIEYLKSKLS